MNRIFQIIQRVEEVVLAFAIIAPVLAYWLSRLARKRLWLIAS